MSNFTKYEEAKQYITEFAHQGFTEAQDILETYQDINNRYGEFLAARFIRDVYLDFQYNVELKEISQN